MTSTQTSQAREKTSNFMVRLARFLAVFLVLGWTQLAVARDDARIPAVSDKDAEAWLVTFSPGEIYWERFGHNAIWLREPAAGLDHTFNFGFFDFEQEDFFLRFLRGRMLYFSVAQSAGREFAFYRQQNRDIRIQRLNLTPVQYQRLRDYLVNEIKPENRDYRYDYYLNNCSTRIRDALDVALNGELAVRTKTVPAGLNFRDHTRRLTQMQFWYYLGLELGLGYPVDRAVSRWDEMFIPMVVADELASMVVTKNGVAEPLVSMDKILHESRNQGPPDAPGSTWFRFLLLGLFVTGLAYLSSRFMPPVWSESLSLAWILTSSSLGILLAALWLFTDHEVARNNANLLLLNPLVLVALFPALRKIGAMILATGVLVAFGLLLLPKHQYNLDVLALLAPINLAATYSLYNTSR